MKYFKTLPKISDNDTNGNYMLLTNLMARASILPSILTEASLYYDYDIQDGDTPELVAFKYYGSTDNFWVVMFSNQFLDPQWDWPLSSVVFNNYITEKYGSLSIATSTVHHYEMTVSEQLNGSEEIDQTVYVIDEEEYNIPSTSQTINFPGGDVLTVTTSKTIVSCFEEELRINEAKRSIKLLDVKYLNIVSQELKKLMGN